MAFPPFEIAAVAFVLAACGAGEQYAARALDLDTTQMSETDSGLLYQDVVVGRGPAAADGMAVEVHYTGWLLDGTKFDSSHDRGVPFSFTLPGRVIDGWNEGLMGMRVGGQRRLVVPPALGYGEGGFPPTIPRNATLVFDIELIHLESNQ